MDRKRFIFSCGGSVAAIWLTASLQSCSKAYYANATVAETKINIPLSEFSTQDKNGNTVYRTFVLVKTERLNFPVAVYRKDEGNYSALYLECTHRGCELNPSANGLQCPCHGSEFSNEGKVLSPPAENDLVRFPVRIEKDFITVELTTS